MDRLSEIRARCDAATLGPWYADGWGLWDNGAEEFVELHDTSPDAAFIAHARKDIPYLLEQHAQLTAEIERLHDLLAERNVLLDKYEAENSWIPVGERLPEKNGEYQCYCDGKFRTAKFKQEESGLCYWDVISGEAFSALWRVTHWRPLPESPKGE